MKKKLFTVIINIYLLCYLVPFSIIFIDKSMIFVYNYNYGAVKTAKDLLEGRQLIRLLYNHVKFLNTQLEITR